MPLTTSPPLSCPLPQAIPTTPKALKDLVPLIQYLQSNQPVTQKKVFPRGTLMADGRLDLCKQNLGADGCQQVIDALVHNTQVASILLGTNGIGDRGAAAVANLVQHNSTLQVVYLGCNAISEVGIAPLTQALAANSVVTGLWLKRNPIRDKGALHIADLLRCNLSIRALDLVNTHLGEEGLATILDVLTGKNRTVQHLYLGGNQLYPHQAPLLADLLAQNPTITGLFLNVNFLGNSGVKTLAQGLAKNHTLTHLGLASNGIGVDGCRELLTVLQSHPTIRHLDLGCSPSTRVLNAQPNIIYDMDKSGISRFLTHNQSLFSLDLQHNAIDQPGRNRLVQALRHNKTLQILRLEGEMNHSLEKLLMGNRTLSQNSMPTIPDLALIRSVYR